MPSVIIADDEEFVRYFMNTIMSSLFFNVVAEVENGDELIGAMRKHNPDILMLDVNMPNVTGLEFLKAYISEFKDTCVIVLTSAISESVKEEISQAGAFMMRKDTPPEKMCQSIQDYWNKFKEGQRV